jgi:hypothetical protein
MVEPLPLALEVLGVDIVSRERLDELEHENDAAR